MASSIVRKGVMEWEKYGSEKKAPVSLLSRSDSLHAEHTAQVGSQVYIRAKGMSLQHSAVKKIPRPFLGTIRTRIWSQTIRKWKVAVLMSYCCSGLGGKGMSCVKPCSCETTICMMIGVHLRHSSPTWYWCSNAQWLWKILLNGWKGEDQRRRSTEKKEDFPEVNETLSMLSLSKWESKLEHTSSR